MAQEDIETDGYAYITQTKDGQTTVLSAGVIVDGGVIQLPGGSRITIGGGQTVVVNGNRVQHITKSSPRHQYREQSTNKPPTETRYSKFLSSPLTPNHTDYVSRHIGRHWKRLGIALGLSRGELEAVEMDYRVEGQYEMAYQTLLTWSRKYARSATVQGLVQALTSIGKQRLAEELSVL